MHFRQLLALAASSVSVASAVRGFDSGSLMLDGTPKDQAAFANEFTNQRQLVGTKGEFTAARLYTMIQGGTTNTVISAIPAAIASDTQLLLGLWASGGDAGFANEMVALRNAIHQYGTGLGKLVTGISVGSEDLYRNSPKGATTGVGASPETLLKYVKEVRSAIKGSALSAAPVGHVDTWNSFTNTTNKAAVDAFDFLGVDEYPYFESGKENQIQNNGALFYKAIDRVKAVANGRPVMVTETGYPHAGPVSGKAVASPQNARSYWKQVFCTLPADVDVYWYVQRDSNSGDAATFGISGQSLSTTPAYDLSCDDVVSSSSKAATSSHRATATAPTYGSSSTSGAHSHSNAHPGAIAGTGSGSSPSSNSNSGSSSGSSGSSYGSGSSGSSGSAASSGGSMPHPTGGATPPYPMPSGMATSAAPAAAGTGSSGTGSSGTGSSGTGSSGTGSSGTGSSPVAGGAGGAGGAGSGASPSTTASPGSANPNGANSVRMTLAFLAVPALVALTL